MKTKKTTTYNNQDASVFCPTEGGCKSVMFSKHPNLLGRDLDIVQSIVNRVVYTSNNLDFTKH